MIRKMEEADLEQVICLEKSSFSEPWSYSLLASGIYSIYDRYYVFEQDGVIAGYANLRLLAGEAEIQRIAVRPDRRGLGIGRELMDAMVTYATAGKAGVIRLEVRESNTAARRLYESYGFGIEAVRKAYYHNPCEDALIMSRQLL
ncbi:MAG: ribosomal protein S18-alanine N-acetyltransferase [Lachnospiraceae bacterium]